MVIEEEIQKIRKGFPGVENQGTFFFRVDFVPLGFYCECVLCA